MYQAILAGIAAAQAIEQAQQAKKQQEIENSKTKFGPWTGLQAAPVKNPNNPFIEGVGGYFKGMEHEDARAEKKSQDDYLAKRGAWYDMQMAKGGLDPNTVAMLDQAHGVKPVGGM